MRRFLLPLLASLIVAPEAARAFISNVPANCASCHATPQYPQGDIRPGAIEVLGHDLMTLDASQRNDSINRGEQPTFRAHPGATVPLTMQVNDGRDRYAVTISNFDADSVTGAANTNFLTGYGRDTRWVTPSPTPNPIYYHNVNSAFFSHVNAGGQSLGWPLTGQVAPRTYTYNLTLAPNTPPAIYELEFTVAGILTFPFRSAFVDSQWFYLDVMPFPDGDYDDNGSANGVDFLIWQRGESPTPRSAEDLAAWQENFGATKLNRLAATVVPEPGAFIMLLAATLLLHSRRNARRD